MMNKATAYFAVGKKEGYSICVDFPINDEFSETLDSATILIANVSESERIQGLESYQECSILIESDFGNYRHNYLIDSYTETETNSREGGKVYSYSIDLMSETKYLEKIQLPNICITHSEASGQRTIYEEIEQIHSLYCPKIKMMSADPREWEYDYLFFIDSNPLKEKFGNILCADISMSQPTMRQALTSLMIQANCIPTIVDGYLSFLDFGADVRDFGTADNVRITKSMASDSYVNTLRNMSDNVLDSEDSVVSESLVFRDRDNLLLKQKENLKLETSFPIYKVTKFVINGYCQTEMVVNSGGRFPYKKILVPSTNAGVGINVYISNKALSLDFYAQSGALGNSYSVDCTFTYTAYLCRWNKDPVSGWGFQVISTPKKDYSISVSGEVSGGDTKTITDVIASDVSSVGYSSSVDSSNAFIIIRGEASGTFGGTAFRQNLFISDATHVRNTLDGYYRPIMFTDVDITDFTKLAQVSVGFNPTTGESTGLAGGWKVSYLYTKDITPLCVESQKRNQLDVDYLAMSKTSISSVDDMAKWLYCTISYKVGDSEISGFSDTYSVTSGWFNYEYIYLENIFTKLLSIDPSGDGFTSEKVLSLFGGVFDGFEAKSDFELMNTALVNPFFKNAENNFAMFFFDVSYVPLNSVNLSHFKESADILLEQLDTSSNGISSAELLSLNQQDNVNRFGNEVISIHERVESLASARDIPSQYEGYTLFKRTATIGRYGVDVIYYGSKNYIIKNYFTSIQTKYRAYEYVDYSKSVLRKDKNTIHILISPKGFIKGSDSYDVTDDNNAKFVISLLDGVKATKEADGKVKYAYFRKGSELYRTEASVYAVGSSVYFTFNQFDNGSNGIYVDGTYLTKNGEYSSDPIGGIPQKWYPIGDLWDEGAKIGFTNDVGILAPLGMYYPDDPHFEGWIRTLQLSPKGGKLGGNHCTIAKSFKKDLTERISYTLQFDFYTDSKNIVFSRWLFEPSSAIGLDGDVFYIYDDEEPFNSVGYQSYKDLRLVTDGMFSLSNDGGKIVLRGGSLSYDHERLRLIFHGADGKFHDMIEFRNLTELQSGYYISVNDTKGIGVYRRDINSVLVKEGECEYNKSQLTRGVNRNEDTDGN